MKKLISITAAAVGAFALMMAGVAPGTAQTSPTITPTFSGPSNAVQGTLFACADSAIISLTGTMITGYDTYFQIFNGAGATGTSLSGLRQASVDGAFTFGERVAFPAGTTVGAGGIVSARVLVALQNNSNTIDFEFNLTDTQDGCDGAAVPPLTNTSVDTGTGTTGTTGTTVGTNLAAPNGVTLNPNLSAEPDVVVGARTSDRFRSETPGLIFAECNDDPLALPGIVYDADNVTVYWSWFTATEEQMADHLANAQYSVRLNRAPFDQVIQSEITQRGQNVYTFYSAPVGNLRAGHYEVEYRVTWLQPVFDGYDDYGPGTSNPVDSGNCNFDVLANPTGASVTFTNRYFPTLFPVHNIFPDD